MGRFYITTPIYYVNDYPHIGHAYCTVCADFLARYHRLRGDKTYFLTGTDEHGQKVQKSAAAEGISPLALADRVVERYFDLWKQLRISHDDFIRTTQARHEKGVLALLQRLIAAGDVYKASYRGPYCVSCEAFFPENQIVEGRCPDFGHPVTVLEEESYFFRLSRYQEPLLKLYAERPDFVLPQSRMNEVRAFVEGGLKDLSISRTSITWGIPYPGDEKHVLYVWLDALSNYVTALGYGSDDPSKVGTFWPADLHLIGKDILRFHAVYWPAFLMSAGLPLPKHVYGHGWWMKDASKMSKSLGNVVDPRPYLQEFGADALRYFLLREKPIETDGSFSDEAFLDRLNADLANDLGNLASRLTNLLERQAGGVIGTGDGSLKEHTEAAVDRYCTAVERFSPREALEAIWSLISDLNKFLVEREPWAKPGTPEALATLSEAARALRLAALCLEPAMPSAAPRITEALGFEPTDFVNARWEDRQSGSARKLTGLFPRVDKAEYFAHLRRDGAGALESRGAGEKRGEASEMEDEKKAPEGTAQQQPATLAPPAPAPTQPTQERISIDEFRRAELRAGKILEAERVPKSNKLVRMVVDFGSERRQIVGGIGKKYAPEQLVGRTCPFVFNLQPAKLMGIESNGMIMAGNLDGEPVLLQFVEEVPPGSKIT
ncbi:MAG: methionine--tRNA ligase [Acidobacteriota bacterium]